MESYSLRLPKATSTGIVHFDDHRFNRSGKTVWSLVRSDNATLVGSDFKSIDRHRSNQAWLRATHPFAPIDGQSQFTRAVKSRNNSVCAANRFHWLNDAEPGRTPHNKTNFSLVQVKSVADIGAALRNDDSLSRVFCVELGSNRKWPLGDRGGLTARKLIAA